VIDDRPHRRDLDVPPRAASDARSEPDGINRESSADIPTRPPARPSTIPGSDRYRFKFQRDLQAPRRTFEEKFRRCGGRNLAAL